MSSSPNYQSDNSFYSLDLGLTQCIEEELQELENNKSNNDGNRSCISPSMFSDFESESDETHAEYGNVESTGIFPTAGTTDNADNKYETPPKLTSNNFHPYVRPHFFEPDGVIDKLRPDVPIPQRLSEDNAVVPVLTTMNDNHSNIRGYKKSALVYSLRQYGKDGLRQNESIVDCMYKLHREIIEFDHADFFPPNTDNVQFDNNEDIKFRVPAYANNRCSSSYSDLTIQKVINPNNLRVYMRYEHKVGIDIDLDDFSIYRHPYSLNADSMHIIKLADKGLSYSHFDNPYQTQFETGYSCGMKRRRMSF